MINISDDKCVLKFGNGDINMSAGYFPEEKEGFVVFRDQQPREIGLFNGDEPLNTVLGYPVRVEFSKIESIDVLIYTLQQAKQEMLDNIL